MRWPGLESHPAMLDDPAMILPEMGIVTADMDGSQPADRPGAQP